MGHKPERCVYFDILSSIAETWNTVHSMRVSLINCSCLQNQFQAMTYTEWNSMDSHGKGVMNYWCASLVKSAGCIQRWSSLNIWTRVESPSCEHGIYASRQCALIARNDACAAGEMPFDKAPNRNLKNTFRVPSGFWECMTLNREMISLECALPLCSPFSPEQSKWVARSRQIISRRVHVHSLKSSAGRQRVRTGDTYKVAQLVQTLLESWQSN
jgi:hypothetical protein